MPLRFVITIEREHFDARSASALEPSLDQVRKILVRALTKLRDGLEQLSS